MNNEEKILAMLEQIQGDIKMLKFDVSELRANSDSMVTDIKILKHEVGELRGDVDDIKIEVGYIWDDIAKSGDRMETHEKKYHHAV